MAKLDKLLSEFDEDNPQHVKAINKITPEQYKDLLLGKYVDPNSRTLSIYTISRILESLTNSKDGIVKNPAKNSKLNNQIVNHLLEEMEDARNSEDEDKKDEIEGRLERMASYLPLSHATFANMLDNGIDQSRLLSNKNTPKSILSKIIDSHFAYPEAALSHPNADQEIFDKTQELTPRQKKEIPITAYEKGLKEGKFSPTEDQIEDILKSHKITKGAGLDTFLSKLSPERKNDFIDRVIGLKGGKLKEEPTPEGDPDDYKWNNWEEGEHKNDRLAKILAEHADLSPHQIDHIKHHGADDEHFALFHNSNVPVSDKVEMHKKFLNDDYDHGYDKDKFITNLRDKVGSAYDSGAYEDYNEDARDEAQESYPFRQYVNENLRDDDIMEQSQDDWMNNYIQNKLQEDPDLSEDDLADEASNAYDQELEQRKEALINGTAPNHLQDQTYNDYDEYLSDDIDRIIRDKHDEALDNALDDYKHLPPELEGQIPHIEERKRREAEISKDKEARAQHYQTAQLDPAEAEKIITNPNDENFSDVAKNPHLSPDLISRGLMAAKKEGLGVSDLLEHPNVSPKDLLEVSKDPKTKDYDIERALSHANFPQEELKNIYEANPKNTTIAKIYKASEHYEDPNKFQFSLGTNKLRAARDLAEQSPNGIINKKDLEKQGFNIKNLGLDNALDAKGNIKLSDIQNAIDSAPKMQFAHAHTTYQGAQHHNNEPSKVFQLNVTNDKIKEMKDAGVLQTYKNMIKASNRSGHPVDPNRGFGWVRYTEKPDGIHVDEIQSDFGQSFVRQVAEQAKEALKNGHLDEEGAEEAIQNAKKDYSDDHFNKISQILMGGEHTNKIIHEGFLQHLRNEGKAGTPIHIWTPDSKAPISGMTTKTQIKPDEVERHISKLKMDKDSPNDEGKAILAWGRKNKLLPAKSTEITPEHLESLKLPLKDAAANHELKTGEGFTLPVPLPVHMRETYGDFPKEMGYKPGKYGEISTQDNPERIGTPTFKDVIKKRIYEVNDLIKSELDSDTQKMINASIESLNTPEGAKAMQMLEQSNPEAHKALMELLDIVAHHYEDSEESIDQHQENEQPQGDGPHVARAKKDQPIHQKRNVYTPGAVRENPDHTARIKDESGEWHQIGSRKSGNAPQEPN